MNSTILEKKDKEISKLKLAIEILTVDVCKQQECIRMNSAIIEIQKDQLKTKDKHIKKLELIIDDNSDFIIECKDKNNNIKIKISRLERDGK